MDKNTKHEEAKGLKKAVELVKSISAKHFDLLRSSGRYYSMVKDAGRGKYIRDADESDQGLYDKPLPCFGCGVGWFSFLSGFVFPVMWYYATILYFGNYYRKDPRERAGLAASAIAAMGCSISLLVILAFILFL